MKVWGELEQALRESEARFRDLTELSSDFYWEQYEQFRFTRRGSLAWEKRAYPESSALGKARWELPALNQTEADWARHRADLEAHREFRDLEIERPLPSGETRWISTSGRPVFDAEGRFRGYRGIGRDITHQKMVEKALRESETRFRALADLSSDWIWQLDEHYRFVPVGFESGRKAGIRPEDFIGRTPWDSPGTNLSEAQWAAHRATLDARKPFRDFEYSRPSADGGVRWVSISGEPVFDERGAFKGYRGTGRDISARKRAEEDLRRFRLAMDSSADMILLVDRDSMRYVDVNAAVSKLLGFTREEMLAMGPQDILPLSREALEKSYDELIANPGSSSLLRSSYRCKDGSELAFESWRRVMRSGGSWIIVATARDMRERLAAEQALREREAQLRLVTDSVPAMIAAFDTGLRYRYVNRHYAEFFGLPASEFVGRAVPDVVGEAAWRELEEALEAARQGSRQTIERRARRRTDGSLRDLAIDLVPYRGTSGALEGIYGMVLDVTQRRRAERERQEVEARMRLVLDNVPAMIAFVDAEFRYRYANRPYLDFYAGGRDVGGADVRSVVGAEAWKFIGPNMQRALAGESVSYVRRFTLGDDAVEVEVTLVPNRDRQGRGTGVHILALDVTKRRRAEEALRLRNRAIESSVNWIMITEPVEEHQRIVYVNPAFEQITGYAAGEIVGRNPALLHRDDVEQQGVIALRDAAEHRREVAVLVRNYRRDGTMFWNELRVAPVPDEAGRVTHFVAVGTDVTDRMRYQEQIERNANYDSLTGLPNRNLLADRLAQAMIQAERSQGALAVMFIDLDHLKRINDGLGHAVGDEVIAAVGARIAEALRAGDTVARLSGDEFVVLLPNLKRADDASVVAQKILAAVARPLKVNAHEFVLSASAGIALYPKDAGEAGALMRGADAALYRAKEDGRDCFRFFSPDLNARVAQFLAVERSLRAAVHENVFFLEYQPIVEIASGATIGAEALIRWRHPDGRMVPPAEFIPVAEESGLIVPIGRWVIAAAARQAAAWSRSLARPIYVSVNLSARQFRDPGLLETIAAAIREAGLDATLLKFEITETTVMRDPAKAAELLQALKDLGVRISVDDFGTGYSSLAYLKRFPIDVLKIDRGFVRDLPGDSEDLALCGAIIDLAHALDLEVVAEGIETLEQAQVLARRGCRFAQGYLFGRPAAPDRLTLAAR